MCKTYYQWYKQPAVNDSTSINNLSKQDLDKIDQPTWNDVQCPVVDASNNMRYN